MKRLVIQFIAFIILATIAFQPELNPFAIKSEDSYSQPSEPVLHKEEIYNKIKQKSQELEEPPQDAKIDNVWKKMPGLNGLKINIEKSYEKMSENGEFDQSLLIYEQVEPEVSLEDLPPSPIYRGHPDKQMVAFLINVAWGTDNIPSMLNTLKKHDVKANFFIEGKWASNNTKLVKMIQEEGHTIGNHAYNHPDMKRLSTAQNTEQIERTNDILEAITDEQPKWFAPPSGSFNQQVVETASQLEMETILWSVDTIDWQKPSTSVMVNRVMDNLHPGAMILMHPTNVVEQGLEELILNIQQKGYKIVSLEKLLSEKR
ncbi:polysaccharide deacetylase family protein [Aquibacillus sediminis]|uniref:polysaccharide deacetylase family protein n=1 Tax=Aquibacillus sediminis TaxID=2574734 RepID=UPI001107A6E0|nr:polysaccharide deacetylase family protein [Aquibacillus sediminis]